MAEKEDKNIEPAAEPNVDMDRIKAMMGPLPFESVGPIVANPAKNRRRGSDKPVTTKIEVTLASAVEEANASLQAMSDKVDAPDIEISGDTPIGDIPVEDEIIDIQEATYLTDDAAIVSAVDDIVAHEGDTVLQAEDEEREIAGIHKIKSKESLKDRLKGFWAKSYVRWVTLGGAVIIIIMAALIPYSRYFMLNTAGVRSSVTLSIIDTSTLQPLKNVTVSVAGVSSLTDAKGLAKIEHIKLGPTKITMSKRAFSTVEQRITVGWGSNPKGQYRLAVSGSQYTFIVTDLLNGKPIVKAEAVSGEGNAISDKDGRIVLALDTRNKKDNDEIDVKITLDNYRTESIKIAVNNKETSSVKMVIDRKDIFITKRSGKYDVYAIDIDGKNEQKIVTGTGIERDDIALAPSQNGDVAAYVATRENARNSDGYLLSTLYLLDIKSTSLTKIDQSEQVQLIGWSSEQRIVYIKIAAGASAANPKRERLMSVNAKDPSDIKELASANSFNDVLMVGDKVLYAPSNAFQDNPKPGLFVATSDGTNTVNVVGAEVNNIFRTEYDTVVYESGGSYFNFKISNTPASSTPASNPNGLNRLYVDNISDGHSLWVDNRDGKGVLLSYDKATKKDTIIVAQNGLKLPVRWLDKTTIIYRVNDGKETSDYVISTNSGSAKKVQDVTDASGIGRWFYY
jgi:hypothetical protein